MGKKLLEMTLEELWQLFPIRLVPHEDCWAAWYEEEAAAIQAALTPSCVRGVHHIGSTAIKGIWAKPIVDILLECAEGCAPQSLTDALVGQGFICMSRGQDRVSLNKGYTENGFAQRVFHLHICRFGMHDELYFRDYLSDYPEKAKEYEALKLRLWKEYEHDRDGYTQMKTNFVSACTDEAKALYAGRYEQ